MQFRTLGLRRAAERSLTVQSPEVRAVLTAYAAERRNAWVAAKTRSRSSMHGSRLTRFRPGPDVDALTVFKLALVPTIVLDDIDGTIRFEEYRAAGAARGFDGTPRCSSATSNARRPSIARR